MQDGQALSSYHPDRDAEDAEDLELDAETEPETEALTVGLELGVNQPGTSDSSIQRFIEDWGDRDADDAPGDGAESRPTAQTVAKGKYPQTDATPGPSKIP